MKKEPEKHLLEEARRIIAENQGKSVISGCQQPLDIGNLDNAPLEIGRNFKEGARMRSSVEIHCCELLCAFEASADPRFIEGVYGLTLSFFTWLAKRSLESAGIDAVAERVTNRVYSVLSELALSPGADIPRENLFGWCSALIDNIVKEEASRAGRRCTAETSDRIGPVCPSKSEAWMRKTDQDEGERVRELVFEILHSLSPGFSSIEKEAVSLYYGEGLSIGAVADRLGLDSRRTAALLRTCRMKVLDEVYQREACRFWKDEDEGKEVRK